MQIAALLTKDAKPADMRLHLKWESKEQGDAPKRMSKGEINRQQAILVGCLGGGGAITLKRRRKDGTVETLYEPPTAAIKSTTANSP